MLSARPVAANQFIDATAEAGHTYFYYVTSVDSKGLESVASNLVLAAVPQTFTEWLTKTLRSFTLEALSNSFRSLVAQLRNSLRSLAHRIHRSRSGAGA